APAQRAAPAAAGANRLAHTARQPAAPGAARGPGGRVAPPALPPLIAMAASIVVMGVSGSGKTRIGRALARALGVPFLDGDKFHPAQNIAKMRSGQPLTDADRGPWLTALNAGLHEHAARGQRVVLACSALKQGYRQQLEAGGLPLHFVYLKGSPALIARRV